MIPAMPDRAGLPLLAFAAVVGLFVMVDFLPQVTSAKETPAAMKMTKIMGPSLRFLYW